MNRANSAASEAAAPAAQLLLATDTTVRCPSCTREFSLEQGFANKALEQLQTHSRSELSALEQQAKLEAERRAQQLSDERARATQLQITQMQALLKEQGAAHERALKDVRVAAEQAMAPQVQALQSQLTDAQGQLGAVARREAALLERERTLQEQATQSARQKTDELMQTERAANQQRTHELSQQLDSMRTQELELRRLKSAAEDRSAQAEVELARRLDAARQSISAEIRGQEQQRVELEKAELQKKLDDVTAKLGEAQLKASQGSQQLQGEVLELALEEQLRRAFPFDEFEEIKKGVRGADVMQRVMTRTQQHAGTILWEAKRARDWSRDWPLKLREDMRAAGADVGILVSTCMPPPLAQQPFGLHEEIWVTGWNATVPLATALRERVVALHLQRTVTVGKGEKMEALYDYLTSPQFAHKLRAVYGAFKAIQEDLQKERSSSEQRWARREKQIATGMKELLGFAGDVQGLAQQELPQLEMEKGSLL